MMVRLLCSVALVAHVFVLVICTDPVAQASSPPTNETSPLEADSANAISPVKPKKGKCHRVLKKCPKNEEFSRCSQSIQRAQYCSEKGQPYQHSEQDITSCKEACVCKENYLRDDNGNCIPAEKCPTTCGDNEILDDCPANCASDYCPTEESKDSSLCVTPDVCPPPVCKCAFNNRRAANGTCIPTRSCPPFDCSARPNEEFNPCPPLCPTDDCSQASPTGECPRLFGQIGIVLTCNPQCRCKKGYWRLNGECVPYGQCPGVCPANERYSECIQGECRALNCTQKDVSVPCVRLDPNNCLKGCVCEEGFLRNESGVCVPQDQCTKETEPPPTCPPNEQFSECIQIVCRAQKCEQKNWPIPCPGIATGSCIKGCVCQVGFLRDDNGDCIPEDQCIPNPCKPSEEFSNCTQAVCRAQNCSDKDIPQACPSVADGDCLQGCVCQEGYFRAEDGYCVPERLCRLNTCLFNEEWSECVQSTCRAQTCSQKGMPVDCPKIDSGDCKSGCICKEYYLRDESGFCVPEENCDKKEEPMSCPPNEEGTECVDALCRPLNCTQRGLDLPCPMVGYCEKACVCKENFLRDENGVCVPKEQCPSPTCQPNEEFSNCSQATCRAQYCSEKDETIYCPMILDGSCLEGCVCQAGYLRDDNGDCVPEEQCGKECGTNQELRCVESCPPERTCGNRDGAVSCAPSTCENKCVCKPGFVKDDDDNNECIPEEECPGPCNTNEEFSNCTQAVCRAQNCSDKDIPQACPSVAGGDCLQGCVCQEGYLRAEDGYCVPEELCSKECGTNQELRCVQSCPPEGTCRNRFVGFSCAPSPCEYKCVCKSGLVKDDNGECILEEKCDKSCSPNEEWSECVQATCRHQNCTQKGMPLGCPGIVTGDCISGCICKENYLRDESGLCVPEEDCDTEEGPKTCPPNEEVVECANALCRSLNCRDRGILLPCPLVSECIKDCVCKYDYLRDENGVCVPKEQCPSPTCQPNEEFSNCSQATCRAQYCSEKDETINCPMIPDGSCLEECVCQAGYLRDDNGDCVPEEQCGKECGTNQELRCVESCPPERTCGNRDGAVSCAPSTCENKCVCKPGFVKDDNNECIPEEECPGPCNTNEEFSNCTQAVCRAQNCSDKDIPQACPSVADGDCLQGCVCQERYLRAEDGYCVPEELCSKECGTNQELRCVQSCPPEATCGNRFLAVSCAPSPCEYKCVCKPGLVKDDNGECILEEQCDKSCSPNEEWSECVQASCRHQNCTQKGMPLGCPGIVTGDCISGCICKENYLRDESGFCVPEEDCDEEEGPKTCPPNEELSECANALCRSLECSQRGLPLACPSIRKCVKDCVCKYGYLRDENGVCVPKEQCPTPTCPLNEQFSNCTQAICRAQSCNDKDKSIPCPGIPEGSCEEGCVCKEGYLRGDNGSCIAESECVVSTCPPNEELSECANAVCRPLDCTQRGLPLPCPQVAGCEKECVCKEGFLRDKNGDCVPEEQCPPQITCSENEVLEACPSTCTSESCPKSVNEKDMCLPSIPCTPACKCKFNHKRADNGTCIPTSSCPPFDCSDFPNEEYVACPPYCPTDECGQPWLKHRCPFRIGVVLECFPKCQCKDGYGRVNGTCVSFEECPNLCPANEEYSPCIEKTCRPQNCSERDMKMETCSACNVTSCQRGCVCKENYFRNEQGVCVSYEECGGKNISCIASVIAKF